MSGYRFYHTADIRQDEIYRYTYEQWGEKQADKYIIELHEHLSDLSSNILLWRSLPKSVSTIKGKQHHIYYSHYNKHYVFFRQLPDDVIGVMTILHETMEIPLRLKEDLINLER